MKTLVPLQEGTFFSLAHGYALFCQDVPACELELGSKYNMSTMLSVWDLLLDKQHVGFFFHSPFHTTCKGGFLCAYLEGKRGKATESKLMLRHDSVMVFDLPSCGAIAVSTKLSPEMANIIQEQ